MQHSNTISAIRRWGSVLQSLTCIQFHSQPVAEVLACRPCRGNGGLSETLPGWKAEIDRAREGISRGFHLIESG